MREGRLEPPMDSSSGYPIPEAVPILPAGSGSRKESVSPSLSGYLRKKRRGEPGLSIFFFPGNPCTSRNDEQKEHQKSSRRPSAFGLLYHVGSSPVPSSGERERKEFFRASPVPVDANRMFPLPGIIPGIHCHSRLAGPDRVVRIGKVANFRGTSDSGKTPNLGEFLLTVFLPGWIRRL